MSQTETPALWTDFLKSVQPLKHHKNQFKKELPPRLRARKAPQSDLVYEIDLHGKTLEEAYQLTRLFVSLHFQRNSQHISIITGKGLQNRGLIKNEIVLWLETKDFQDKISSYSWMNDGGVLKITLKRNKEKCRKKSF